MKKLRHLGSFTLIILLAILLTACSGMDNQASTAPTPKQDMNNGNTTNGTPAATGQMDTMQGIVVTANPTGDMNAFIHTGMAMVNGKQAPILLNNKDFAVYTYKPDPMLQSTCTGD